MSAAGYAGIIGTLAFVLGLILVVAKAARRFLPGNTQGGASDAFSVVQRISLGQRQGIAIIQRGDMLVAVSVGDGGVRMLFTAPHDASTSAANDTPALAVSALPSIAATPSFRKALRVATRSSKALSALFVCAVVFSTAALAQEQPPPPPPTPPPTPPTVQQPVVQALAVQQPSVQAPVRSEPSAALSTSGLPSLRTLPAPGVQAGPRDQPTGADAQVPVARPTRPARTASRNGGGANIAPLIPAPQARGIASTKGSAPLSTPESRRIAQRADSMLTRLAPQLDLKMGGSGKEEGLRLSGTVGVVIMMGLLSLLPVLLLMMTGFTRILIVLHFLKQALGTQTTPPGQLVAAMALMLSGFVMAPTLREVNSSALEPWMDGKIEQVEMMQRAVVPFKTFMLKQVRDQDLQTFVDLADAPEPATREAVPLVILMSAFVTSELRTAFQIGFALFLPFIVIDVVVSSVLMSMGMVMLPPAMISLPFKLLLFVLVDGWGLVITGLVQSFR